MKTTKAILGKWKFIDFGASVVFRITDSSGIVTIEATDQDNGERLDVTNVRWTGEELMFTTYCVSTDYTVDHRVVPESRGRLLVYVTAPSYLERVE